MVKRLACIGVCAIGLVAAAAALATAPGENGPITFRRWTNADQDRSALFTMNADGSGVKQIRAPLPGGHDDQADWSPDGKRLVFSRFPDRGPASVFVMAADGSGARQLSPRCTRPPAPHRVPRGCEDAANASFTPDGEHVLYTRATGRVRDFPKLETDQIEHSAIAIIKTDGTNEHELLRLRPFRGDTEFPQMSPDGRLILFERGNGPLTRPRFGRAVFVMRADGSHVRRVTPWRLHAGDNPDWAPDSSRIVFRSNDGVFNDERSQLFTVRPDGTGLTQVTHFPVGHRRLFSASFSPDGQQIVFARAPSAKPRGDIWAMNADGSNQHPLFTGPTADSAPDWGVAATP